MLAYRDARNQMNKDLRSPSSGAVSLPISDDSDAFARRARKLAPLDRDLIALLVRAMIACGRVKLWQNLGTVFAAPNIHSS